MIEREAFLKRLAEDEDDTLTRLVYADWLDDRGDHEEADRQRKWPAAKEWLVRFCQENSHYEQISYQELIDFGRQVVTDESPRDRVYLQNEAMWSGLQAHSQEFWKHWYIVTGMSPPPSHENKGFHYWRCCAHEVSYWFGSPDLTDPDE